MALPCSLRRVRTAAGAPFDDDVDAQCFPVPPGVSKFGLPGLVSGCAGSAAPALIWFGGALLVLIALALFMVLVEQGRSRRRRSFIFWALGVGVALFGLLLVGYSRLPGSGRWSLSTFERASLSGRATSL